MFGRPCRCQDTKGSCRYDAAEIGTINWLLEHGIARQEDIYRLNVGSQFRFWHPVRCKRVDAKVVSTSTGSMPPGCVAMRLDLTDLE